MNADGRKIQACEDAFNTSMDPECSVLVVDDDPDCLEEYAEVADSLGFPCGTAGDARSALRLIAGDPRIGIVVTDLAMPGIDGISFLDILAKLYSPLRPLVPLVVTGFGSMERVVAAMRSNAIDFLEKPVTRESFWDALLRASRRRGELISDLRISRMLPLKDGVYKKASCAVPPGSNPQTDDELLALVKALIQARHKRAEFLDAELFADPAWDILLDLTAAKLQAKTVPISSACAAANVPMTTALRYIRHLVDAGLVRRWKDTTDARRFLLELEEPTMRAMMRYLASVGPRLRQHKPQYTPGS